MKCKYCEHEISDWKGCSLSENSSGESFAAHNECWQQSGDDGGYVERLGNALRSME